MNKPMTEERINMMRHATKRDTGIGNWVHECLDEIIRLQAVVDKLPKTADGVSVVPGMKVWVRWRTPEGTIVRQWETYTMSPFGAGDGDRLHWNYAQCYSTEAAARAAKAEGSDDES